jgi:hypothetical protein
MNSHNHLDDLIDLSLRHSLKNWATHKHPPANAREQLLGAVKEEASKPKPKRSKFNLGWTLRFPMNQEAFDYRPIYGYRLESVYALNANMAIL